MVTAVDTKRTVRQHVDDSGKPSQANATSNVWVPGATVFSESTDNNEVTGFTTGEAYFTDLIAECQKAKSEICVAGWQISWDALIAPGMRFYDLVFQIASRNKSLKIYVMPWEHSLPVETYDRQTGSVLLSINQELKTKQIQVFSSPSYADADQRYYAHHQKQVVIDRKIAYVGGMDICYGRYDDATFDLHASKGGREGMNRYNGCVEQVAVVNKDELIDPDLLTGGYDNLHLPWIKSKSNADDERARLSQPGHWQVKYKGAGAYDSVANAEMTASDTADMTTLDPRSQPRMPWQDLHCKVEGPAVSHLLRNFVLRWNIIQNTGSPLEMPAEPATYAHAGGMQVQVLRSAPAAHRAAELKAQNPKPLKAQPAGVQNDIHEAMVALIKKSNRFIYIENQFFVSDFGTESPRAAGLSPAAQFIDAFYGGSQNSSAEKAARVSSKHDSMLNADLSDVLRPPTNQVVAALIERIRRAIDFSGKAPFHVYITLPVHSEGTLCTASTAVQIYWTMQTLAFGSHSLLNGIRRALKARDLREKKDAGFKRVFDKGNTEYEDVETERCFEFVTLLNLRNWVAIGDRYLTEQVYVHTKLMIVDDLYVLMGSANINDRSLLGSRDSELAVLVVDKDAQRADVNGSGSGREVRTFARNLRMDIWKKLFGITGGVRPATELAAAVKEPGKPESWRLIQKRATKNAALYEAAFPWVPRSLNAFDPDPNLGASILPTWNSQADAPKGSKWGAKGKLDSPMPFQKDFWAAPRHIESAVGALEQIKGFITALPIMWTKGENNRFEYPTALVADNESPASVRPEEAFAAVDSRNQPGSRSG